MLAEAVLREALAEAEGANGNRRAVIQRWARLLGLSEKTLYRLLRRAGMETGRKTRADRGVFKGVPAEQLEKVASLMVESWTEKYRTPTMPAWTAIQMAERLGIIEEGALKPGTLTRWMRLNYLGKHELAAPTPHVEMKSAHPNEMHQYDVSVCVQWYIREDGGIGHQRRNYEIYKNKEGKPRQIKRHLIVDHYSGAFFVAYAESEDTATSLEFLFDAWGKKNGRYGSNGNYVFRGAPERLYTDNGSVIKSAVGQQVCARLGIDLSAHLPGSPRAKGSVESMMWKWEQAFESQLRRFPATSLEELNQRAFEFARWYNSERIHTRHGMSRFECWARIEEKDLRELPEDRELLRSLALRASEERQIDYRGIIRWDGNLYLVPDQGLWGKSCLVGPDVFSVRGQTRQEGNRTGASDPGLMIIVECEGKKFKLAALRKDEGGFTENAISWGEYKSPRETGTERAVKNLAVVAEGIPVCEMRGLGRDQKDQRDIKGEEIVLGETAVERTYTRVGAKAEIIRRLGYAPLAWQREVMEEELSADSADYTEGKIDGIMKRIAGTAAEQVG